MSNVLNKLHDADQPQEQPQEPVSEWYLRTDDGEVYGPVVMEVMQEWAAQSRIAPGNGISPDGEEWVAAESVPDLKMEWMADLPDGSTYGPFNVLAVPNLYQNGSIPAASTLSHTASGKTVKVADILTSHQEAGQEKDKPALEKAREKKWETLYKDEKKARIDNEAELQREIDELQESRPSMEQLRSENDEYKEKVLTLESDSAAVRKEFDETKTQMERLSISLNDKTAEVESVQNQAQVSQEKLSGEIRQLQLRLSEQKENYEAELAKARLMNEELESKLDQVTDDVKADSSVLSRSRERITELEHEIETKESAFSTEKERLQSELSEADKNLSGMSTKVRELESRLSKDAEGLNGIIRELREKLEKNETEKRQAADLESGRITELKESLHEEAGVNEELRRKLEKQGEEAKELNSRLAEANSNVSQLRGKLDAATSSIENLETEKHNLNVTFNTEKESLTSREQNLKDEVRLLKARVEEQETQLSDSTSETASLTRNVQELESSSKELQTQLATNKDEYERVQHKLQTETEHLRKAVEEKDARTAKLTDELTFAGEKNKETEAQLHRLQEDYRQLEEDSGAHEKDLREQLDSSSAQLAELRETSDSQISEIQNTCSDLKQKLETSETDGEELTDRLNNALSRLASTAKEAGKQKRSLESQIQHLESQLAKKSQNIDQLHAELSKIKTRSSDAEQGLRSTLRMLERRDISGRKQNQKLEAYVKELETEKRTLTRENNTLAEEVKDALTQLKHLRKQVAPLNRKVNEQEELLKKQLAGPPAGSPPGASPQVSLTLQTMKLRLQKTAAALTSIPVEKRVALLLGIAVILLLSVAGVKYLFRIPEEKAAIKTETGESQLKADIEKYMMEDPLPDLALDPVAAPVIIEETEKVHAWPGISGDSLKVKYGDHECTITFRKDLFKSGTEMTLAGSEAIGSLLANRGERLKPYRIVITGLSQSSQTETAGDKMADYALRIRRAEKVRDLFISESQINPSQVFTAAGDPEQSSSRSAVIRLQRAE